MGVPNPLPEFHTWQKAEDAASIAEQDCVVLFRAYRRLGGFQPPMALYHRAWELRLHADALRRALWGM